MDMLFMAATACSCSAEWERAAVAARQAMQHSNKEERPFCVCTQMPMHVHRHARMWEHMDAWIHAHSPCVSIACAAQKGVLNCAHCES